jgi:hypothetical protein
MNVNKTLLKAVVMTALMESLQSQGKQPTEAHRAVVLEFNDELAALEAAGIAALDQPIDDVFESLLATLDTLEEASEDDEDDSLWLQSLQAAGVDNWEGYDYACEIYNEMKGK